MYLTWKLIHVASVIIFLGNIITGLFWAAHAHKSRDYRLITSTFEGIIRSDRWFTIPGVVGIVVGGVGAAMHSDLSLFGTGWILWPIILFSISGIVFAIWVAPLQRRVVELATNADDTTATWNSYSRMYRRWELWGLLALITPVIAFVIMVLKPELPVF